MMFCLIGQVKRLSLEQLWLPVGRWIAADGV